MPFPIAIPIVIGVGLGIAAIAAALSSNDRQRIVLIGPRGSGKTTWSYFMAQGTLTAAYEPSDLATDFKASVDIKGHELLLRVQAQVGSTEYVMTDWQRAAERAGAVFYLADLSKLNDDDYMTLLERHARIMARWSHRPERLTLVLTHLDRLTNFPEVDLTTIEALPTVTQARQRLGAGRVVVGHLADHEGAATLTYTALLPLISPDGESR